MQSFSCKTREENGRLYKIFIQAGGIVLPWPARGAAENIAGWFDQPPRVRYAMSGLRTITVRTPRRVGLLEIIYYF